MRWFRRRRVMRKVEVAQLDPEDMIILFTDLGSAAEMNVLHEYFVVRTHFNPERVLVLPKDVTMGILKPPRLVTIDDKFEQEIRSKLAETKRRRSAEKLDTNGDDDA